MTSLADDWGNRNGRLADALLRLVLRPGTWFYPIFGPMMLTAVGAAVALLLTAGAGLQRTAVWLLAAGLSVIPLICWLMPALTGDVILWTAAAINYPLPLGMLAASLALLLTVLSGRDLPWWVVCLAAVLIVLTDAMQEVTASAMFSSAMAVVIALRGRLNAKLWTLVGAATVAFAVHMSAGGLWKRAGLVVDISGEPFPSVALRGMATALSNLWYWAWPVWLVLIAALLANALRPGLERRLRFVLLLAACSTLLLVLVCGAYNNRYPAPGIALLRWVLLVDAAACVAFIVVAMALFLASTRLGHGPLLVWVAFVGSCVFPFASGALGRTQFVPLALLTVAAISIILPWLARLSAAEATSVVVVAFVVPAALWLDAARIGAAINRQFVDTRIVAPLETAANTGTREVVIPEVLPRPSMAYSRSFYLERYERAIAIYYGLPEGTLIRNP